MNVKGSICYKDVSTSGLVAGYILTTLTFGSGVVGLAGILHHFQMLRRGDHPPHTCGGVTLSFSAFMLKKVDEND